MKIAGSGTGAVSGSVIQRYGSADPDPDPYQNVTYQYRWIRIRIPNTDPDPGGQKLPKKVEKISEISCFEVLDVLF